MRKYNSDVQVSVVAAREKLCALRVQGSVRGFGPRLRTFAVKRKEPFKEDKKDSHRPSMVNGQ
jgi:hypothetical protein